MYELPLGIWLQLSESALLTSY